MIECYNILSFVTGNKCTFGLHPSYLAISVVNNNSKQHSPLLTEGFKEIFSDLWYLENHYPVRDNPTLKLIWISWNSNHVISYSVGIDCNCILTPTLYFQIGLLLSVFVIKCYKHLSSPQNSAHGGSISFSSLWSQEVLLDREGECSASQDRDSGVILRHGNELSSFVKFREFLGFLRNC